MMGMAYDRYALSPSCQIGVEPARSISLPCCIARRSIAGIRSVIPASGLPGLRIVERAGLAGMELVDARLDPCACTVDVPRNDLRRAVPAVAHGRRHAKRGNVQGRP